MQYVKRVNQNKIVQALNDVNTEVSLCGYFITKEDVNELRETQRLACLQNKIIEFDIQILFLIAMQMSKSPYITIERFIPSIKEMILTMRFALDQKIGLRIRKSQIFYMRSM